VTDITHWFIGGGMSRWGKVVGACMTGTWPWEASKHLSLPIAGDQLAGDIGRYPW
jgi:hypothetical protein